MVRTLKKRYIKPAGFLIALLFAALAGVGQTVTELVVPKYFGSKTAASANNARTAFAVCIRIDGLTPATAYDLKPGLGLVTDATTTYGAGNYWTGTTFAGTTGLLNCFTTDASGSSGPVWIFFQPTGNASRFDAGQQHNVRLGWVTAGGVFPSAPLYIGTKVLTALDIAVTARTPATTDDGCFVKGSCLAASHGKYMLMYDNIDGTGDPLFAYMIMPSIPTQVTNAELPVPVNDIYMQTGTAAAGDYPAIVPLGANNPNGVRRVESRNADNTLLAFNTTTTGTWPSGANTTTAQRRDVIVLTNSDTPLNPVTGVPAVTTSSTVTNISFNSATGGGNVTNGGTSPVTARGLCWSTSANPTIAGNHTTEPGTTGAFLSNMTGLLPSTTYHMRAYATNSTGTSYGADVVFSTLCEVIAPLPDFAASKVNLTVGESINFYDSTQFCPESWSWSFNGGSPATSTAQNPTGITYNFTGDFTVCLTATNQWGQQTTCKAAYIHVIGPTNAPLVMTEINYRSPLGGTDSLEFIELYNNGTQSVDLAGFAFTQGIEYTFPAMNIAPQTYLMIGKSASLLKQTYGVTALQWNAGSALSNGGEAVVLKDDFGFTVDSVHFLPSLPWDTMANGKGPSLELCDPSSNNALPSNWRHAVEYAGQTANGDTLYASPLAGCSYLPVADFTTSDSTIILGQTVQFTDASSGGVTAWFWEFERGNPETYNGQNPPPVIYNIMGAYDVRLTVWNATGKAIKYKPGFIQVGPAGTGSPTPDDGLSVIPNPVDGDRFTARFATLSRRSLVLLSAQGTVLHSLESCGREVTVPVPAATTGLCLLQVTDLASGATQTVRIVVR